MSVFSNTATDTKQGQRDYQQALLDLLAGQDALTILRETPSRCTALLSTMTETEIREPESEGKWSVADVIHHLCDSEIVLSNRMRRILAESMPTLAGYDQNLWADKLRYSTRPVGSALALFAASRTVNLEIIDGLSDEELAREGQHSERGNESVSLMIQLYAGHDVVHQYQIERIQSAVSLKR